MDTNPLKKASEKILDFENLERDLETQVCKFLTLLSPHHGMKLAEEVERLKAELRGADSLLTTRSIAYDKKLTAKDTQISAQLKCMEELETEMLMLQSKICVLGWYKLSIKDDKYSVAKTLNAALATFTKLKEKKG